MDQSILLPLLPVAFMFLFVLLYFILYANFLQKLCTGKWHYCRRQTLCLTPCQNLSQNSPGDFDENYIQLKAQLTRIYLAEAEALRLAKLLSENNEQDAKEYISNLRMTMFPYGLNNNPGENSNQCSHLNTSNSEEHFDELPPPKYDDCV